MVPKERLVEYEWFQVRVFDWRDLALAFAKVIGLRVQNAFASKSDDKVRVWYYTGSEGGEVDLIEASIGKLSDSRPLVAAFNEHLARTGSQTTIVRVHGILNDRRHRWFAWVTPEEAAQLAQAGADVHPA
jgi:hypothetical protein